MLALRRILHFVMLAACCSIVLGMLTRSGISQTVQREKNCTSLSAPGHYPDYESLPPFKIERKDFSGSKAPKRLMLQISIDPQNVSETALVRLACHLAHEFASEDSLDVLIFDDQLAAKNLALYFTDQKNYGTYLWHLRAHSEVKRLQHIFYLEFVVPDVREDLLSLTRIRVNLRSNP